MNAVPNLKSDKPNNIFTLGNRLGTLRFYLFLISILSLQGFLMVLTLFNNQLTPPQLSSRLEAFANLVQNNQYEKARTELNEINSLARGRIEDSTETQINNILAAKFASITAQIIQEKSGFATYESVKEISLFQEELLPMVDFQLNQITTVYYDTGADYDKITYYLENLEKLGFASAVRPSQSKLEAYRIKERLAKKAPAMVVYQGPIEHIFFHPLLAYPELAFDNDQQAKGFNDWFVTVKEFKRILASLYKNNYMLIDIHAIFNKPENGQPLTVKTDLLLPAGKKPLIISVDDLNYYKYMLPNGTVHKLILDEHGNIATFSLSPQGIPITSRDNEIVPILDQFIQDHEDFSLNGAKGILALTGYEGVLGYRTNELASPSFASEKDQALIIIKRLKETGWTFASHGYGHLDARKIPLAVLLKDTQHWLTEVATITGPTDVYIYPYGSSVLPGDPKFQSLLANGFKVLCAVGPIPYLKSGPDHLMMDRRHIDGMALHSQAALLKEFFESSEIIDEVRPK